MFNNNISTNNIKNSIKISFNWTKLNWIKQPLDNLINNNKIPRMKYCRLCDAPRGETNYHLMWLCTKVERLENLNWKNNQQSMKKKVLFLEKIQRQIDLL